MISVPPTPGLLEVSAPPLHRENQKHYRSVTVPVPMVHLKENLEQPFDAFRLFLFFGGVGRVSVDS